MTRHAYVPPEVVGEICSFLEIRDRPNCRLVSRTWFCGVNLVPLVNVISDALFRSSKRGNLLAVRFVLDHGADIHALSDVVLLYACEEHDRAIAVARAGGHSEIVSMLLERISVE